MLKPHVFTEALNFAVTGCQFAHSQLHGEDHWRAVAAQGIWLAREIGADRQTREAALLFGLFHDCRRINDGWDPEHGARAAAALDTFARHYETGLPQDLHDRLHLSLTRHDMGETSSDAITALGWDADRSCLGRVGVLPEFTYFSLVPENRFDRFVDLGTQMSAEAPTWGELFAMTRG